MVFRWSCTHAQTCDSIRVQAASEQTLSDFRLALEPRGDHSVTAGLAAFGTTMRSSKIFGSAWDVDLCEDGDTGEVCRELGFIKI